MAHELLAKSDHQLGMCLRMLYAEFEVLERRYQTLIG